MAALVALVALLVAVPLVLLRWGRWPITGVPTWEQVQELPTTLATDSAVLALLTLVLWAAWAGFVVSVVLEVAAQVGGRASLVRLGPLGSAARYLVGSLVLGVGPLATPGAALASAAGPLPATASATAAAPAAVGPDLTVDLLGSSASPSPVAASAASAAIPEAEPVAVAPGTVSVGRGDTAWSLAQTHLGDGARWREVWELNEGRVQPDGATWTSPDAPLRAGWVVSLPTEVTVAPGDNLWDLAEAQVEGAWGRDASDAEVVGPWQEMVDANLDRLAPPGDPDLIHPGEVMAAPMVPADPLAPAIVAPAPPAPPHAPPPTTAPAPADADAGAAEVLPDGSVPEVEPPATGDAASGLPDAVAPGREVPSAGAPPGDVPEGTAPVVEVPEGATPTVPEGATPPAGAAAPVPEPPATVPEAAAPLPSTTNPPVTAPAGGGSRSAGPVIVGDSVAAGAPTDDEEGPRRPAAVGLAGGGVAVAGALVLLDRRRRAQQRRRRRGRVVPFPAPPLRAAEHRLRWGADVDAARLLDVSLRAAAAGAGATGMPQLRWVEASAESVVLVLAAPSPPAPGFAAAAPDRWVTVAGHDELAHLATRAAPPAPSLVPLGPTDDGSELLVELEADGILTVEAAYDETLGLLRSFVVAASTGAWSDQVRVVAVGLEPEVGRLPGVTVAATLDDALALAERHADSTEDALRSVRCPTLAQARAVGVTPEHWDPLLVVAAVAPAGRRELRRAEAVAARPTGGVGVVAAAGVDAAGLGRRLTIGGHGWLQVDGVDEAVRPRHLAADDLRAVTELLDGTHGDVAAAVAAAPPPRRPPRPVPPPPVAAEERPVPPDPAARADHPVLVPATAEVPLPGTAPVPPLPARRLDELMGGVEVLVRVLGEVDAMRTAGQPPRPSERLTPARQRALEAVAYLALRESAVDREDLEISLYPDGANATKTFRNTVTEARSLVGDALFPPPEGGRYELSPAVLTDYGVFCELVASADETEDAEEAALLLTDALGLVRGEPFTGVGRSYAWVGPHRGMIVAQVVDAAEELAEVRLAIGDWRAAEWAARQGLRAFPSDERMYRLLMRTARAAGNIPGVQRVFRELCDVLADPDVGVEPEDTVHPETVELLEELTGSRAASRRRGLGA